MRVFIAGATGALGVPLVRRLIADGHNVTGLSRCPVRVDAINELGVRVVVADALDAPALRAAVASARPEVVIHALTAIPARGPLLPRDLEATNALRITGTRNLLAAAISAGASRIIVESMVFVYGFGDLGDAALTEESPTAQNVPKPWLRATIEALVSEEIQVIEAIRAGQIRGNLLRFGGFYGPGTGTETMLRMLRRRALPIVPQARSRGLSWVHIHDAAAAVVATLAQGQSGAVYNIADDEPATLPEMVLFLAQALGAPRPWSIPAWVMRLAAPFAAEVLDTTLKVSNARAKRELGWIPRFATYREGIAHLKDGSATSVVTV